MAASVAEISDQGEAVRLTNILLATDFSNISEQAYAQAIGLARRHGSKLRIVHVCPETSGLLVPQLAEGRVHEVSRKQLNLISNRPELKDVPHELSLLTGSVCTVLREVVRREGIDLLVIGTHGRGQVKKLVLGSVAEEMVRLAPCPVLTVGPGSVHDSPVSGEFHHIVYATDFGRASTKAIRYAVFFARDSGAKLTLVHVMPPAPLPAPDTPWSLTDEKTMKEWRAVEAAGIEKRLASMLPPEGAGCEVEYVVPFDFLFAGILKVASEKHPDLLVIGAAATLSPKAAAHAPGTVVHQIMCHAPCPVLTTRA